MIKNLLSALSFVMATGLLVQPATASDCSGPWNVLTNRNPAMTPCAQLGLDTKRGVCQPGQAYETLCDDAEGNRYRICQGPRPCRENVAPPIPPVQEAPPCTTWDYTNNRPCPSGYLNKDCRGDCAPAVPPAPEAPPCTTWDYKNNRPCPPGYLNKNCRGGCRPVR